MGVERWGCNFNDYIESHSRDPQNKQELDMVKGTALPVQSLLSITAVPTGSVWERFHNINVALEET